MMMLMPLSSTTKTTKQPSAIAFFSVISLLPLLNDVFAAKQETIVVVNWTLWCCFVVNYSWNYEVNASCSGLGLFVWLVSTRMLTFSASNRLRKLGVYK